METFPPSHPRIVVMHWFSWVNGVNMFRLLGLLCVGIYAAMLIGGQDRGQIRFGLMQDKVDRSDALAAVQPAPIAPAAPPVVSAAFVPDKPLIDAPAPSEIATPDVATQDLPDPVAQAVPQGRVLYVAATSVNVREGPGKDHAVVERLPRGEAVLVLSQGEGQGGWSRIRIEGDGVEGYVASSLLRE